MTLDAGSRNLVRKKRGRGGSLAAPPQGTIPKSSPSAKSSQKSSRHAKTHATQQAALQTASATESALPASSYRQHATPDHRHYPSASARQSEYYVTDVRSPLLQNRSGSSRQPRSRHRSRTPQTSPNVPPAGVETRIEERFSPQNDKGSTGLLASILGLGLSFSSYDPAPPRSPSVERHRRELSAYDDAIESDGGAVDSGHSTPIDHFSTPSTHIIPRHQREADMLDQAGSSTVEGSEEERDELECDDGASPRPFTWLSSPAGDSGTSELEARSPLRSEDEVEVPRQIMLPFYRHSNVNRVPGVAARRSPTMTRQAPHATGSRLRSGKGATRFTSADSLGRQPLHPGGLQSPIFLENNGSYDHSDSVGSHEDHLRFFSTDTNRHYDVHNNVDVSFEQVLTEDRDEAQAELLKQRKKARQAKKKLVLKRKKEAARQAAAEQSRVESPTQSPVPSSGQVPTSDLSSMLTASAAGSEPQTQEEGKGEAVRSPLLQDGDTDKVSEVVAIPQQEQDAEDFTATTPTHQTEADACVVRLSPGSTRGLEVISPPRLPHGLASAQTTCAPFASGSSILHSPPDAASARRPQTPTSFREEGQTVLSSPAQSLPLISPQSSESALSQAGDTAAAAVSTASPSSICLTLMSPQLLQKEATKDEVVGDEVAEDEAAKGKPDMRNSPDSSASALVSVIDASAGSTPSPPDADPSSQIMHTAAQPSSTGVAAQYSMSAQVKRAISGAAEVATRELEHDEGMRNAWSSRSGVPSQLPSQKSAWLSTVSAQKLPLGTNPKTEGISIASTNKKQSAGNRKKHEVSTKSPPPPPLPRAEQPSKNRSKKRRAKVNDHPTDWADCIANKIREAEQAHLPSAPSITVLNPSAKKGSQSVQKANTAENGRGLMHQHQRQSSRVETEASFHTAEAESAVDGKSERSALLSPPPTFSPASSPRDAHLVETCAETTTQREDFLRRDGQSANLNQAELTDRETEAEAALSHSPPTILRWDRQSPRHPLNHEKRLSPRPAYSHLHSPSEQDSSATETLRRNRPSRYASTGDYSDESLTFSTPGTVGSSNYVSGMTYSESFNTVSSIATSLTSETDTSSTLGDSRPGDEYIIGDAHNMLGLYSGHSTGAGSAEYQNDQYVVRQCQNRRWQESASTPMNSQGAETRSYFAEKESKAHYVEDRNARWVASHSVEPSYTSLVPRRERNRFDLSSRSSSVSADSIRNNNGASARASQHSSLAARACARWAICGRNRAVFIGNVAATKHLTQWEAALATYNAPFRQIRIQAVRRLSNIVAEMPIILPYRRFYNLEWICGRRQTLDALDLDFSTAKRGALQSMNKTYNTECDTTQPLSIVSTPGSMYAGLTIAEVTKAILEYRNLKESARSVHPVNESTDLYGSGPGGLGEVNTNLVLTLSPPNKLDSEHVGALGEPDYLQLPSAINSTTSSLEIHQDEHAAELRALLHGMAIDPQSREGWICEMQSVSAEEQMQMSSFFELSNDQMNDMYGWESLPQFEGDAGDEYYPEELTSAQLDNAEREELQTIVDGTRRRAEAQAAEVPSLRYAYVPLSDTDMDERGCHSGAQYERSRPRQSSGIDEAVHSASRNHFYAEVTSQDILPNQPSSPFRFPRHQRAHSVHIADAQSAEAIVQQTRNVLALSGHPLGDESGYSQTSSWNEDEVIALYNARYSSIAPAMTASISAPPRVSPRRKSKPRLHLRKPSPRMTSRQVQTEQSRGTLQEVSDTTRPSQSAMPQTPSRSGSPSQRAILQDSAIVFLRKQDSSHSSSPAQRHRTAMSSSSPSYASSVEAHLSSDYAEMSTLSPSRGTSAGPAINIIQATPQRPRHSDPEAAEASHSEPVEQWWQGVHLSPFSEGADADCQVFVTQRHAQAFLELQRQQQELEEQSRALAVALANHNVHSSGQHWHGVPAQHW